MVAPPPKNPYFMSDWRTSLTVETRSSPARCSTESTLIMEAVYNTRVKILKQNQNSSKMRPATERGGLLRPATQALSLNVYRIQVKIIQGNGPAIDSFCFSSSWSPGHDVSLDVEFTSTLDVFHGH